MVSDWASLDEAAQARLTVAAEALPRMNPDLVEWTVTPVRDWGLRLSAEITLTNAEAPLEQLASLLRQIARELLLLDVDLPHW